MEITLTVKIINEKDYQDLHITDNYNNSCNYGDSNYSNGMCKESIVDCVKDFLKDYHKQNI